MREVKQYPFEPRSSKDLQQGDFWPIALADGRYAAAVMLAHTRRLGRRDNVNLLVALFDWVGSSLPTASDLACAKMLKKAFVHVKAIESCGSLVIGRVVRDWGPLEVDFALAGAALPAWGLLGMQYQAEMRWGNAKRMADRLKADLRAKK
jgi:hypothetical protein